MRPPPHGPQLGGLFAALLRLGLAEERLPTLPPVIVAPCRAGAAGDFDSPLVRLSYTSLTTPNSVIDYHTGTGRRAVKKVQPVLGGFEQGRYVTERVWAPAKDGVKVRAGGATGPWAGERGGGGTREMRRGAP